MTASDQYSNNSVITARQQQQHGLTTHFAILKTCTISLQRVVCAVYGVLYAAFLFLGIRITKDVCTIRQKTNNSNNNHNKNENNQEDKQTQHNTINRQIEPSKMPFRAALSNRNRFAKLFWIHFVYIYKLSVYSKTANGVQESLS